MNYFHAALLGVVEGITEFLPVSSTGHLILAARLLRIPPSEFLKSFEIIIQLGAILAVIALYWKKLFLDPGVMKRVFLGFVPAGILGFIFHKAVRQYFLGSSFTVVWAMFLGGIGLILIEWLPNAEEKGIDQISGISWGRVVLIGVFQALAMVPGVSRSAATILGGLVLGLKRETAVEFSFLLAVPTMLAATGLDLARSAGNFSQEQLSFLGIGFLISFLVAVISIKFLLQFIKHHNFIPFGVYRIAAAMLFWMFVTR